MEYNLPTTEKMLTEDDVRRIINSYIGNALTSNARLGVGDFKIGNSSENYLHFDGKDLNMFGALNFSIKMVSNFESTTRLTSTVGGSGAVTAGDAGLFVNTASTATSFAHAIWQVVKNSVFAGRPVFTISMTIDEIGPAGPGSSFFGIGNINTTGLGTTHDYASYGTRCGFKILKDGTTLTLYATQSRASGETASSALTTITLGDRIDLILKLNTSKSVDYYWRLNAGAFSSKTTLYDNTPKSGDANFMLTFSISNDNAGNKFSAHIYGASYER